MSNYDKTLNELIEAGEKLYTGPHKIIDGDIYHLDNDDPDFPEAYYPIDWSQYGSFILTSINARSALKALRDELRELREFRDHYAPRTTNKEEE